MKKKQIFQYVLFIVFIVAILNGGFSCKQSNIEDLPVLDIENVVNKVILIDNVFHYYTNAECYFLENSSTLNPSEIRNVQCFGNDLYLVFSDLFLHYDLVTGNLVFRYKPSEKVNFTDFTFDQSTQRAYILDNEEARVFELAMNGEIIKSIKLDTEHTYSAIRHLGDRTFLIPVQTVPYPSFVTVDFEQGEVKEFEFIKKKRRKIHDVPENSDSIWVKYPLYVADETPQGVLVKYLFDDRVYLYTKDDVKAKYLMNLGKQKVKYKFPWSITKLKNNDRFRIIRFWHSSEKTYVIYQRVVKNTRGIFDYKTLSQFKNFISIDAVGGFIAKNKLASLVPGKEEIFMDSERKRFLSIRKLDDNEKKDKDKWPQNMLEAENENDLVVSIFIMK